LIYGRVCTAHRSDCPIGSLVCGAHPTGHSLKGTDVERREFLQMSAAAGAYAVLGAPWRSAAGEEEGPWFDRPMRWAQLVLVENDPGRFDPDSWLDYFKRVYADAVCLSAGGIVAYYPTKVP
jgi:hypothetical protein